MTAAIGSRQNELNELCREIFGEEAQCQEKIEQTTDDKVEHLTDETVIARMLGSINANEIESLLNGDTSAYGGDDSAADMALCDHLAFWTGKNRQQMDRIFRQSKLMRPKWDEKRGQQTYGEITIDKACSGTSKVYALPKELWEASQEEAEALTEAILEERGLTISEEELDAFKLPDGPKFECKLPNDHFIQRFIAYGTEISDAYPDYWMAGALYALAVVADKKIKVVLRQGTVYPNLYVSINGKSSLARKSTAVDKTEEMLLKVLQHLLPTLVPTEFSPEAFIEHLSNFQHAPWIRDEAAGVLSLMKKDYMRGFKDSLMQLFDCKPFHRKLRTSQRKGNQTDFNVDDPYLNLLWATTDASLGANTDQNDTLSGFLARFIFFFPQGMKPRFMPLEEGTAAISIFEDVIVSQLRGIVTKISEVPECVALHISPEAAAYYNPWQETREREWTASNDGAAMQIFSRLNPMVVKLGMLFELGAADFDPAKPIRLEFIEEACRLVDEYLMPTARAIYDIVGSNSEKNAIDRTIAYLKNHGGKATRKEIMRDIKIKSADFNEYLATMIESEMVETKTVKRSGKGRDSVYVFLLPQTKVAKVANVANVAKIAKVEEIPSENVEGKDSTLATLATKATFPIVATIEDQLNQVEEAAKAKEAQFKTPIKCTSCGKDITNKTQLTKNGKTYCRDCGDLSEPKPCSSCAVALRGDKSAIKCDPCIYLGRATA